MNKHFALLLMGLLFSFFSFSQAGFIETLMDSKATLQHNQSTSYITLDKGLNNFKEPLLTEFALRHHMYLHSEQTMPNLWLEINPEVGIRMLDSSFITLNPRFKVDFKLYYDVSQNINSQFFYLGFGHHSNGQNDPFLNPSTGEIDIENGDFATDYFQLGFLREQPLKRTKNGFFLQNYYLEVHPGFFRQFARRNLYPIYDQLRLGAKWQYLKDGNRSNSSFLVSLETKFLLENIGSNDLTDQIIADLKIAYQPRFFKSPGFWLMVQGYYGEDFYQIYFHRQVSFLRFGIMMSFW